MPNFQSGVNQAVWNAVSVNTAAKNAKKSEQRAIASAAVTSQLASLSKRLSEVERAKAVKKKSRAWLDNILGGAENG